MTAKLTAGAKGVYVIAATPFAEDGSVDHDSIGSLTRFYLELWGYRHDDPGRHGGGCKADAGGGG